MATDVQIKTADLRLTPRSADVAIRAGGESETRYRARFRGPEPRIREEGATLAVEYPRLRGIFQRSVAELELDPSLAWALQIEGGVSGLIADLRGLRLRSLEIAGGASDVKILLPHPSGRVAIHIGGGACKVTVRRPSDTPALLRIAGGANKLAFDDERFGAIGGEVRLTGVGAEDADDRYEIDIGGGASSLSITTAKGGSKA